MKITKILSVLMAIILCMTVLTVTAFAAESGDSVGGILESAVIGIPAGIGEPFFDSVESEISHILFSIPAVKFLHLLAVNSKP